jgi:hypothetical protein
MEEGKVGEDLIHDLHGDHDRADLSVSSEGTSDLVVSAAGLSTSISERLIDNGNVFWRHDGDLQVSSDGKNWFPLTKDNKKEAADFLKSQMTGTSPAAAGPAAAGPGATSLPIRRGDRNPALTTKIGFQSERKDLEKILGTINLRLESGEDSDQLRKIKDTINNKIMNDIAQAEKKGGNNTELKKKMNDYIKGIFDFVMEFSSEAAAGGGEDEEGGGGGGRRSGAAEGGGGGGGDKNRTVRFNIGGGAVPINIERSSTHKNRKSKRKSRRSRKNRK